MNQSELMQRFVTGQFDGHMKPVGDLHIMYDGWGGKLMYNGQEIASRDVAYDKEADEHVTKEIWLVSNINLPTREHRVANKLRSIMDDLGYRFTGEKSEVEVHFPHVTKVAGIEVFRHPDGPRTIEDDLIEQDEKLSKHRYIVLTTYGTARVVPNHADYEDIRTLVGGDLGMTSAVDRRSNIYVNDNGLLEGLDVNTNASLLAGQTIVGNAVVTGLTCEDGEDGFIRQQLVDALLWQPVRKVVK